MMESVRVKKSSQELVEVRAKLTACRLERANSRPDACEVTINASRLDKDAVYALMAVFGEVTDATKRKVTIIMV